MEYNPFQHQDQTNSEARHAQECTHMNDIVFLLHPDLKIKVKDRPTKSPNFQAKRANKPFYFFRPVKGVSRLMPKDEGDVLKCIAVHPLGITHVGK